MREVSNWYMEQVRNVMGHTKFRAMPGEAPDPLAWHRVTEGHRCFRAKIKLKENVELGAIEKPLRNADHFSIACILCRFASFRDYNKNVYLHSSSYRFFISL